LEIALDQAHPTVRDVSSLADFLGDRVADAVRWHDAVIAPIRVQSAVLSDARAVEPGVGRS
jgi:hypothetical protein